MKRGALLAILSAIAFGLTAPFVERAGRGVGSFTTAGLLYAGASICALLLALAPGSRGPKLSKRDVPFLLGMGLLGAAVAPTLLALGLQRTGAMTGSLLLNLEAVFTVLLARVLYRELIGRRVGVALTFMAAGGVVLGWNAQQNAAFSLVGALAVGGATLAWAGDNTLSRKVAERDPLSVVAAKGALGALITLTLTRVVGEGFPGWTNALQLLVCGATGYGLSLRLYLLAQRRIGAARTGSIFALAPFVGAATAWGLGDRSAGAFTLVALLLFAIGVYLHATERHSHRHAHAPITHEHAHRHDDGHHAHVHDPPVEGEHSHHHAHDAAEHEHEHAPDLHHDHGHA